MEYLPYIILTLFTLFALFALAPALVANGSTMTYWEAVKLGAALILMLGGLSLTMLAVVWSVLEVMK